MLTSYRSRVTLHAVAEPDEYKYMHVHTYMSNTHESGSSALVTMNGAYWLLTSLAKDGGGLCYHRDAVGQAAISEEILALILLSGETQAQLMWLNTWSLSIILFIINIIIYYW